MRILDLAIAIAVGFGLVACASPTIDQGAAGEAAAPGSSDAKPTMVPVTVAFPTAAPMATQASAAVTYTIPADVVDQLANLQYSIDGQEYTLTDGAYSDPAQPIMIDMFPPAAVGDLNGDGVDDAGVLLAVNTGGSGVWAHLAAVLDQNGAFVNVDTVVLEDRVDVNAMTIAAGVISLDVTAHGPDDPMCCPSQAATWTYALDDGKLRLTSESGPMTQPSP